jgi:DNA-binding transcriptional LysR family regulator
MRDAYDEWMRPQSPDPAFVESERCLREAQEKHASARAEGNKSWRDFIDRLRADPDQLRHLNPATEEGVDRRLSPRLGTYRMVVCGAPDYLAKRGTPKLPEDLAHHNCMHFSDAAWDGHAWLFRQGETPRAVSINGDLKANNIDSLRRAAVLGQGLIYLPSYILSDELESGCLVPVLKEFSTPEMPINAIYPHREFMPSKVRSFIDLAAKQFHEANWNKIASVSAG